MPRPSDYKEPQVPFMDVESRRELALTGQVFEVTRIRQRPTQHGMRWFLVCRVHDEETGEFNDWTLTLACNPVRDDFFLSMGHSEITESHPLTDCVLVSRVLPNGNRYWDIQDADSAEVTEGIQADLPVDSDGPVKLTRTARA